MGYKEELQQDEWTIKCMDILQRDNFMCQDCNRYGIHYNTIMPIQQLDDINKFVPDDINLTMWIEKCQWKGKLLSPINLEYKCLKPNLYRCSMHLHTIWNSFSYYTNCQTLKITLKEFIDDKISYSNSIGRLFAFEEDLKTENYITISSSSNLEIKVFYRNKLYYFFFNTLYNSKKADFFKRPSLHVHHKYYIKGNKAWEYDNDTLITLCNICHQKRHQEKYTPIYTHNWQIYRANTTICDKCDGSGFLPQYYYNQNGVCFNCNGEGVIDFWK